MLRVKFVLLPAVLVALVTSVASVASVASAADVVVLKNGQRISGTLDPSADIGPDQVAIKTSNGILRLPRSAIASEDLGFDARKARLAKDDLAGHLGLAAWCRAQGMNTEALALLDRAVRLKDVPLAARALHARLVDEDEKRGPQKALELYRRYKQDGGDDPLTLQRLAQLEKAIADFEAQSNAVTSAPAVPKAVPTIQGGLESKGWDNEAPQWSNPVRPQIITVPTDAGVTPALKIEFKGGTQEKATIKRTAHLTIGDDSVLTFFALTPGDKPLSIAIGVKTGSKYLFHESPQQQVKPGQEFQKLRFDFKAANFKSAASSWNYNTRVGDLNDVKEIQLLIYNGSADGVLIISNMGFPAKPDL
ncbi:MAG: tetratricopeptide repeat protein [Planctomycetes bacterium]|nr:tetratricopeptide repeat protein [Planctomycetota bacterium]